MGHALFVGIAGKCAGSPSGRAGMAQTMALLHGVAAVFCWALMAAHLFPKRPGLIGLIAASA